VRSKTAAVRDDIADIQSRLQDAERSARQLPHREKYLLLATGVMRRFLELHLDLSSTDRGRRPRPPSASGAQMIFSAGDSRVSATPGSMNSSRHVALSRAPGQIERVDRQAVTTHTRARIEAHEAVRFGGRGVDDLPDVDSHAVAHDRELFYERDVHRAEDVLEQLRQFGDVGRGDADDVVANLGVELLRTIATYRGQPADDLGVVRIVKSVGWSEAAPTRRPRCT
jgi:hypothetical protein